MIPVSPAGPCSEHVITPVALEVPRTPLAEPQRLMVWPGFLLHLAQQWQPSAEVQEDTPAPVFFSDLAALCSFSDINCSPQVLADVHKEPLQPPTCSGDMKPS